MRIFNRHNPCGFAHDLYPITCIRPKGHVGQHVCKYSVHLALGQAVEVFEMSTRREGGAATRPQGNPTADDCEYKQP